jgi:hypothetical protein
MVLLHVVVVRLLQPECHGMLAGTEAGPLEAHRGHAMPGGAPHLPLACCHPPAYGFGLATTDE